MKRKLLIVVGVALLAATLSTIVFYKLISGDLAGNSHPRAAQRSVVVAQRELPRGTKLTAEDLALAPWPAETVPAGAFSEAAVLEGRFVQEDVRQGEPLMNSRLASPERPLTAAAIPPGMRAVSVHVSEYAGVTELIEAGDRVDILAADGPRQPGNRNLRIHTVLENVAILATGREPTADSRQHASPVVTLLVEAEDVESLSLADQSGAIRLVLRNPLDGDTLETRGRPARDPFGAVRETTRPAAKRAARSPEMTSAKKAPAAPPSAQTRSGDASAGKLRSRPAPPPGPAPSPDATLALTAGKAPQSDTKVLLAVRFAGLGDQALQEFTSRVEEQHAASPLILSRFRAGWDAANALDTLRRQKRLEVFAEPNILALQSVETRFEKVSEISLKPVPGAHADSPLDWDQVGIKVAFIPKVTGADWIRMRVRSEVSVPDPAHSVSFAGVDLPRISRRTAAGEIELADRQSFWIRGLIDRPGAWDLLRRLFPHRPLQQDRNDELVILVTPQLIPADVSERDLSTLLKR